MNENRCTDPDVGLHVLSHDLLDEGEREELELHLQTCLVCRDLRQQVFGKEGALDEIAWRAFRGSQRQRVEPHAWVLRRLRDLWIPLLLVVLGIGGVTVYLARRAPDPVTVGILHLAYSRNAEVDTLSTLLVPRIDAVPASIIVRTDREARVYVYESSEGNLRRLIPPSDRPAPNLVAGRTRELGLPVLQSTEARVLLVLVPQETPGKTSEWDDAVFTQLGGGPEPDPNSRSTRWPGDARPTLRWVP